MKRIHFNPIPQVVNGLKAIRIPGVPGHQETIFHFTCQFGSAFGHAPHEETVQGRVCPSVGQLPPFWCVSGVV